MLRKETRFAIAAINRRFAGMFQRHLDATGFREALAADKKAECERLGLEVVPLVHEGKAIGLIAASSVQPGAMPEKQKQLLRIFADHHMREQQDFPPVEVVRDEIGRASCRERV